VLLRFGLGRPRRADLLPGQADLPTRDEEPTLDGLEHSSETFGGTAYVATIVSPTLFERVSMIVRRLPSHVMSADG